MTKKEICNKAINDLITAIKAKDGFILVTTKPHSNDADVLAIGGDGDILRCIIRATEQVLEKSGVENQKEFCNLMTNVLIGNMLDREDYDKQKAEAVNTRIFGGFEK